MSPTYVHRSNLYSDRHLPFPIVFLVADTKTKLKLNLNPLLCMSLNDIPFR